MRPRAALVLTILAALGAAGTTDAAKAPPAAPVPAVSWADAQIQAVTAAGLLGGDPAAFRPDDPLTRGELADALAVLGKQSPPPADPARLVTTRELHSRLVGALGLAAAARRIRVAARDAGLKPTAILGTETVARLLGLRFDHPQDAEARELLPTQPVTRAEAAYSLARVISLTPEKIAWADELSRTFVLPELTDLQRAVLERALKLVGYPYVFAGASEKPQQLWSSTVPGTTVSAPGGFDCSGFLWRVYKTQPFDGAPQLTGVFKGRTTFAMSAEIAKPARVAFADLQPGDVLFFGGRGPRSTPAQIGHAGLYVGNGWFVHSSGQGVTLQPLQNGYVTGFAWARRPLAEAGLSA